MQGLGEAFRCILTHSEFLIRQDRFKLVLSRRNNSVMRLWSFVRVVAAYLGIMSAEAVYS